MALRSFARFGSSLSLTGSLQFPAADTYLRYNSGIEGYVNDVRSLTMKSTGGTLHGAWTSDATVTTSDRRLKRDIIPLTEALGDRENRPAHAEAGWALRELRPVAYKFRAGAEAKYTRFGFIADEIAKVLPELIRPLTQEPDGPMGIVLPDLIALLVEQAQKQQRTVERLSSRVDALEHDLATRVTALEAAFADFRRWAESRSGGN
jgi:hypothetical protein